ncbi:MAG: hypothetical protein QOK02_2630 [Mycobacterium sp.]|nr:hypothetical protein [Mycobacterium sp.]
MHYEGTAMSAQILALVGSLRSNSDNRRLAEAAIKLAPNDILVEIFDSLADPRYTTKTSTGREPSRLPTGCAPKFSRLTLFYW